MEPLRKSDPENIGPARLVARLGSGGMGTVYLASIDNSSVALKVVKGNFYDDPALKTRFEREITTMRNLRSPFVAKVVDSLVDEDDAWLAIEFINGDSLADRVKNKGPLEGEDWWTTLFGSLVALEEIHSRGVLHRDVKPANILLSESGPKFVDFGIAQVGDETSLTTTGLLAGSPAWLSPEQLDEHRPTPAADIFSLASTMVFAANGSSPWGSPTDTKVPVIFNRILTEPPRIDTLTDAQRDILQPMLEKDPSKRPSAQEILQQFLVDQPPIVKRKIAGWISLYYLDQKTDDLPADDAAVRTLDLLEYTDRAAQERLAQAALSEAQLRQESALEVAKKEAEQAIAEAQSRQESALEAAKREAEQAKAQAAQEISEQRKRLEAEIREIQESKKKSAAEAARLTAKMRKEAEAKARETTKRAQREADRIRKEAERNRSKTGSEPANVQPPRRNSLKVGAVGLVIAALIAGAALILEQVRGTQLQPERSSSENSAESVPDVTGLEKGYLVTLWPREGDTFLPGQSIRPSLTFGRNYDFAPGGEPTLQIVPLENQPVLPDEWCHRDGGTQMQDGGAPNYSVGCKLGTPGKWLVTASWTPVSDAGEPFTQSESISAEIIVSSGAETEELDVELGPSGYPKASKDSLIELLPGTGSFITADQVTEISARFEPTSALVEAPKIGVVPLAGQPEVPGCPRRDSTVSEDGGNPDTYLLSCTFKELGAYGVRLTWKEKSSSGEITSFAQTNALEVERDLECFRSEERWWRSCIESRVPLPITAENSDHEWGTRYDEIASKTSECDNLRVLLTGHDGIAATFGKRTISGSQTTMVSTQWYAKLRTLDTNFDGVICSRTSPD